MHKIFRRATLFTLGAAALVLSGCASTDAVQKAQSTADQALSAAQAAQQSANQAQSAATAAGQKADQNSSRIDALGQRVDSLDQQLQQTQTQHKGPRG